MVHSIQLVVQLLVKNLAIGEGLRVYGGTELTGALDLNSSADISGALVTHDNVTITADNKTFKIQNGSGADKFVVDTDNGNTELQENINSCWRYHNSR